MVGECGAGRAHWLPQGFDLTDVIVAYELQRPQPAMAGSLPSSMAERDRVRGPRKWRNAIAVQPLYGQNESTNAILLLTYIASDEIGRSSYSHNGHRPPRPSAELLPARAARRRARAPSSPAPPSFQLKA